MVKRALLPVAKKRLDGFPVVVITGPRQCGKTTFARQLVPHFPYASLEDPDQLEFADTDPRGFLKQFPDGAILDEIQRCPKLLSYLQGIVDKAGRMGRFVLTGSQQFGLLGSITQSLAGRAALLNLPPFSLAELQSAKLAPDDLDTLLCKGLYPPVYDRPVEPSAWMADYISTYIERDVRQLLNVKDLSAFQRFLQLCAGRTGQLLNITSLASDTGISRATAEAWLSVLEASYVIFYARPRTGNNISSRLIKMPKLYFYDCGLAAWLAGIREPAQISRHPLRGNIFEGWAVSELLKAQAARGQSPRVDFLRDKDGNEVDAAVQTGSTLHAVEIKSGQTVASDFFDGLDFWRKQASQRDLKMKPWLVYGGESPQTRERGTVVPWSKIATLTAEI